jgi:hypothetical protein
MPLPSSLERDVRAIREELGQLRLAMEEKRQDPFLTGLSSSDALVASEVGRFPERMDQRLAEIEAALTDLEESPDDEHAALQIPLTVRAAELEAEAVMSATEHELEELSTMTPAAVAKGNRFARWIKRVLIPALKKVMGKAWQILAKLLVPKGWKIKGKIGNDFLGLASAEIEISFGA